ncbi:hypothetical protein F0562_029901 [Nyssa sinensis]|uniref:Uncharacterized protein n=1 Tax=Nyssa sinensis TaxID=561372 RepID=A0A5J5AVC7_9ASTE|nr:hypothetical protein F0562_029901 [Nyssa sinensis]
MMKTKTSLFPLVTISIPLTTKSKRNLFDHSKGVKLNRVFYGGECLLPFSSVLQRFSFTRSISRLLLLGNCVIMLTSWMRLTQWVIISADWAAVLACSMAITGLLHNSKYHRQWLWYSCFAGVLLAIFWLYYMLRLPKFRWDVIWLPFGPLSGAGICLYVDHLLNVSSEEVRKLRGYMYTYKAS